MSFEAAYHEAGHAVLARKSAHHEVVGEVSLGAHRSGCTAVSLSKRKLTRAGKPVDLSSRTDPDVARDLAVILCAGLVAEKIAKKKGKNVDPVMASAMLDHGDARIQLVGAGLGDDLVPYETQAEVLLEQYWDQVEALAAVLLNAGSCDAVDVHDLVPA